MFTSYPRFNCVLTVAALSAGFIASAHARPTDLDWKPGTGAVFTQTASAPQRNLGAPFHGPRQTIPTPISDGAPLHATLADDAVRWVGPRNTVPARK